MVFGGKKASGEKVIGVAAYFIDQTHSTAIVLTAVNYSDRILLLHGVVYEMYPMLPDSENIVLCKDDKFVKIDDWIYK
eukprot:UN02678